MWIGGGQPEQTAQGVPYEQFSKKYHSLPHKAIPWLNDKLRPLGLLAGTNEAGTRVIIGRLNTNSPCWTEITSYDASVLNSLDDIAYWGEWKNFLQLQQTEMEQREYDHRQLYQAVQSWT
jgi:hypothetical protein